jgi:hypothetical protein
MTTEETTRKAKFIELVEQLKTPPKTRTFSNAAKLIEQHEKGVSFLKAEIIKPETITLLGDDYESTKTAIDVL